MYYLIQQESTGTILREVRRLGKLVLWALVYIAVTLAKSEGTGVRTKLMRGESVGEGRLMRRTRRLCQIQKHDGWMGQGVHRQVALREHSTDGFKSLVV